MPETAVVLVVETAVAAAYCPKAAAASGKAAVVAAMALVDFPAQSLRFVLLIVVAMAVIEYWLHVAAESVFGRVADVALTA